MFEALKAAMRRNDLRRHSSTTPTGMLPAEAVSSAAVLLPSEECTPELAGAIRAWFVPRGVAVSVFAVSADRRASAPEGVYLVLPRHLNCLGRVRRSGKVPPVYAEADMFVSLFEQDPFAVEYAARCSTARFKAGRSQLDGDVYDLVIQTPDGETAGAADAFGMLASLLEKIR